MNDVVADVRRFLEAELRIPNADTLDPDYPLVKRGVLDSIELAQVVAFVEKTYDIRIEDTDMLPGNLGSLSAIAALVHRKHRRS